MFYENDLQKTNQTVFKIEKVTKKKVISYKLSGKVMIIVLYVDK